MKVELRLPYLVENFFVTVTITMIYYFHKFKVIELWKYHLKLEFFGMHIYSVHINFLENMTIYYISWKCDISGNLFHAQAPVVQTLDNIILQVNHYLLPKSTSYPVVHANQPLNNWGQFVHVTCMFPRTSYFSFDQC